MGDVSLGHSAPENHYDRASEGQPTGCHVGQSDINYHVRVLLVHTATVLHAKILQLNI